MEPKYIVFTFELIGTVLTYVFIKNNASLAWAELFMLICYSLVLMGLINNAADELNNKKKNNANEKEVDEDDTPSK